MATTGQEERYIKNALGRLGDRNRSLGDAFVRRHRNQGLAPGSIYEYVKTLTQLERHMDGRAVQYATPDDLESFLAARRESVKHSTLWNDSISLRRLLRFALDVDELPRPLQQATYVRPPENFLANNRIITNIEFHALLKAACRTDGRYAVGTRPERAQAILWLLWDSGFRAGEVLSLNVGHVAFDGPHGATLTLPPEDKARHRLKTGPRTVYVCESAGALRAWLDLHPAADDPGAPLFPHAFDRTGTKPLGYQAFLMFVRRLGAAAGMHTNPDEKRLSPHDFRHTLATRKAKGGWMEAELRKYFGWAPGSRMPSHYVHLALADMRDRVRRDAGVDDLGYTWSMDGTDDLTQLRSVLKRLLSDPSRRQAIRTRRINDNYV